MKLQTPHTDPEPDFAKSINKCLEYLSHGAIYTHRYRFLFVDLRGGQPWAICIDLTNGSYTHQGPEFGISENNLANYGFGLGGSFSVTVH